VGDSAEGGGGSVHWSLEAKKVGTGQADHQQNGQNVKQKGKDDDLKAKPGFHFTISIRTPDGFTREEFLAHLRSLEGLQESADAERVFFNLPIEEDKEAQIRVSWGESDHHEGTGGTHPELERTTT